MDSSSLSLRDFAYVSAVAKHGHFGRAAKECGVSQPALSAQILKLEAKLGIRLFERANRRVTVTAEGEPVIEKMRKLLLDAEGLLRSVSGAKEPLTGPLRLGSIATVGPYLWPHVLTPLLKAHPSLRLNLREGMTDRLLEQLRDGSIDLMIASRTFEESGLSVFPLYDEKLFAALPADHALAKSRSVSPRELATQPLLLMEGGHCLRDETVDLCRLKPREGGEAHAASLETLRHLVASGAGVAVLPGLAVEGFAGSRTGLKTLIEYRPIDGKSAHREIALYARSSDPHLANARALARVIRNSLRMDSVRVIDRRQAS